jgi:mannosylglycerate hydrolase
MKKNKIYIVTYTHWDREFRFDFETTRMWLVRLWDNLIEIFNTDKKFKHFMADGQFVLIDDYLEVRPENEEALRSLAKEGKLQLGPWYTLPDSSSVNGEALIRNLMTGIGKSREFGSCMELGYSVFSFGQISQLPQIYSGFGIDKIIFYKHMNRNRSKYDEFIWESPDGTKALASRLGSEARWNYFFAGHIPIVYSRDPWHKDWRYDWGQMGKTFHLCDPKNYSSFHFLTEPETGFNPDKIKEGFKRTIATLKNTAFPEHLLFFDGTDFTEPHPETSDIIKLANEILGNEYEIIHSTLEEYFKAIKPIQEKQNLDVVKGHMKDGPPGSVHTDVLSVHPELKRMNSLAENMLFRFAEPFATVAFCTLGRKYPKTLIDKALMYMFKSQAHDTLHGVGPNTLVSGVEHRLLQSRIIAENLLNESMQVITSAINTMDIGDSELFLVIFNASPYIRDEVIEAYIDIPQEWNIESLIIQDKTGNPVEIYELEKTANTKAGLYHPRSRNMPFYIDRYRILMRVENIPALGYKTFKVKYIEEVQYPYPHEDFDRVLVPHSPVARDTRNAENEYIKLKINPDGSLQITDKQTGKVYDKLNYYLDEGQNGNQQRCMPLNIKKTVSTLGIPAEIALTMNTNLIARFEIKTGLKTAHHFDKSKNQRSYQSVIIPITTVISIKKDSPVIDVETTFNNTAKDHFLRVCFDTGIKSDKIASSVVFDTEEYPTSPSKNGIFQRDDLTRHQQQTFMSINDGESGFTILNDSIRDYEVLNAEAGLIAQSLIRSVELRIPCDNRFWLEYPGDDSAQSLGRHTSRYGIFVHPGSWKEASVYKFASEFNIPLKVAQFAKQQGSLPLEKSYLEIENSNIVLSALKKSEQRDSVVFRVYNPTDEDIKTNIHFAGKIEQAYFTDLSERRQGEIKLKSEKLPEIKINRKKIITIEVLIKKEIK